MTLSEIRRSYAALADLVTELTLLNFDPLLLGEISENVNKKLREATKWNLINEHRCPKCRRAITDLMDVEFLQDTGMCIGCDHVMSDVIEIARDAWN